VPIFRDRLAKWRGRLQTGLDPLDFAAMKSDPRTKRIMAVRIKDRISHNPQDF
jgi:hypothetical protein